MKRILLITIWILSALYTQAAEPTVWGVDECMQYAVDNSFTTARAMRNVSTARENYTAAIGNHLPQISASVGATANFGRGIDPATNTYNNTTSFNNSYGLGVSIPVFNALQLLNNTLMNKVAVARSRSELQKAQDDIALKVMQYFAQVQYTKGLMVLTERRVENFRRDLELATRRSELGTQSSADVAQFAATLATEEVALISRRNEYTTALLNLKDLMNFPIDDTLNVADEIEPEIPTAHSAAEIFSSAEAYLPAVDVLKKQLKEQKYSLLMAKSAYYPSISLNGGLSSNFFSIIDGGSSNATKHFTAQLTDNFGQYVGASVSIPIFRGMAARTQIHKAKITYNQAQSDFKEKMRALRVEIEQAVMDLDAAASKFESAKKSVAANKIAYRAAQEKYRQGVLSVIELQTSSNQLLLSEVELLMATLTLEMKNRQVAYYRGEPLIEQ